ncbi:MAG TPA: OsmC family protein [Afifellaceae bacterium]|nr:OsmC family protein [Afifellaceae bacterium]
MARSIETSGFPLGFRAAGDALYKWPKAEAEGIVPIRCLAGALQAMQKEALVHNGASGETWYLTCDEGPYLNGTDLAPFPLAFFTAGLAASYLADIAGLASAHGTALRRLELVQDNRYTMEGSALQGTMIGGALPVELEVTADAYTDNTALRDLVNQAVAASPATALLATHLSSRFSLVRNGAQAPIAEVGALDGAPLPRPQAALEGARPVEPADYAPDIIAKLKGAETVEGEGGAGSSLQAEQKRTLHVRGHGRIRDDGLQEITIQLFKPIGSSFRILSDSARPAGERGRAPTGLELMSAGIAFCFLTQLGRYAHIVKQPLDHYSVVQDTRFILPGAFAGTAEAAEAAPVESHVHIDAPAELPAVQRLVAMGERTCFLHAACRGGVETHIRLTRPGEAAA